MISIPDALSQLSPLVIGDEHVFLGLQDPRFNRIARAIHLRGRAYAEFAENYFEELWSDDRAKLIRRPSGLDHNAIKELTTIMDVRTAEPREAH